MTMRISRTLMIRGLTMTMAAIGLTACSGAGQKPQAQATQGATPAQTPTVIITTVEMRELNRQVRLPGELQAYQDTALYAKVPGFVEDINVDRGSVVRQGQLLARLRAPELDTQRSEAEAKVRAAQSQRVEALSRVSGIRAQRLEAEAKLAADESTYQRMKAASATPGVVAGNDLEIAQRAVEAGRARIQLWNENEKAAQAQVKAIEENERALSEAARSSQNIGEYLRITAPFDGVITERNVHQGSLASPRAARRIRRCSGCSRFRDCAWSCRYRKRTSPASRRARRSVLQFRLFRVNLSAASCGASAARSMKKRGRCRWNWT